MEKLQLSRIGRSVTLPPKLLSFEPTHTSRYLILASLLSAIDNPKTTKVLDVGGKKGLLGLFPGFKPTIIDIEDGDEPNFVQGSALAMPFKDNEFDYSVSCDVLEHIEEPDREQFLSEMLRVSRKGVVVCAPFNSPGNEALEIEMDNYYHHLTKKHHRWLKEHIDNGLPSEAAVEKQLKKGGYQYIKFRHFSPTNWRTIVKHHLLHTAFGDNDMLEKAVLEMYRKYYETMCSLDFSEDGYRTFFWISKKGEPKIVMPSTEDVAKARASFTSACEDIKLELLEHEMKGLRKASQLAQVQKEQLLNAEQLAEQLAKVTEDLERIESSKGWRALNRARSVHHKVNRILSGKNRA